MKTAASYKNRLESLLKGHLSKDKKYLKALEIVHCCSQGKVWLVGGTIYRALVYKLYHRQCLKLDYDFVVESFNKPRLALAGWEICQNRHGSPRFRQGRITVDIIPLSSIHTNGIKVSRPSIKTYLAVVPLTIQSIAYEIDRQKLIGSVGLASILSQRIFINNQGALLYANRKYGFKEDEFLNKKVRELGFQATLK